MIDTRIQHIPTVQAAPSIIEPRRPDSIAGRAILLGGLACFFSWGIGMGMGSRPEHIVEKEVIKEVPKVVIREVPCPWAMAQTPEQIRDDKIARFKEIGLFSMDPRQTADFIGAVPDRVEVPADRETANREFGWNTAKDDLLTVTRFFPFEVAGVQEPRYRVNILYAYNLKVRDAKCLMVSRYFRAP